MKGLAKHSRRVWLLAASVLTTASACGGDSGDEELYEQGGGTGTGGGIISTGATGTGATGTGATGTGATGTGATGTGATGGVGGTGATGTGATGTGATGTGATGTGATGTGATGTGATGTGATGTGATGGAGGTGATGGTPGAGGHSGNPMCPTQPDAVTDPLIDDLENGDDSIPLTDDRSGFWYTFNDGTGGTQTPPPQQGAFVPEGPGANNSSYAAHTYGEGFVGDPGIPPMPAFARMDVPLRQIAGNYCAYDASAYTGISFYARGNTDVYFRVATLATMPTSQGGDGRCQPFCYDHHSVLISLSSEWQQYSFSWGELSQRGFGTYQGPIEPTNLLELQWEVLQDNATNPFDIWVDDIAFVGG